VWKRIKELVPSLVVAGIEATCHPVKQQANEIELRRSVESTESTRTNTKIHQISVPSTTILLVLLGPS